MTILDLAKSRKTSRIFKKEVLKQEDITYILETAIQAPSGSNAQPWRFIVVTDANQKLKIREAAEKGEKSFYESISDERKKWYNEKGLSPSKPNLTEAPILIVVLGNKTAPNYKSSIWVSIAYTILAIEEKGLATVTYTPSDPTIITTVMDAPSDYIVEAILPIGYSNDTKRKEDRKKLSELTYENSWGNRLSFF